jgi:glycyl-tRNA synthetase
MSFEEVTRLGLQRGFFFKSVDSYPNTPAGFWDYGPLGVPLRNNFVELWRRMLVRRDGMLEIDGSQIMPKQVFVASGHLEGFSDPIVECPKCHSVYRADQLLQEKTGKTTPEKLQDEQYDKLIEVAKITCPNCHSNLGKTRRFNMMFKVGIGPLSEEAYLRPETAQSIFVDFPLLFKTQRIKLPVGIAQFGKSFRNEIAPRQGFLRLREFYQAEVEVFFNPKKADENNKFDVALDKVLRLSGPDEPPKEIRAKDAIANGLVPNRLTAYYLSLIQDFYSAAGVSPEKIRLRKLTDEEKAFYSTVAYDLEVDTSVGWLELVACNYRSGYDLEKHATVSKSDFSVLDGDEKVSPHVFELSMGVDRSLYALLEFALTVGGGRKFLRLKPYLAPIKVGVFPLVPKDGLAEEALRVHSDLKNDFESTYDESGSIGRRYARADEIGIPYCLTVDYDSLKDQSVTLRARDDKTQTRVRTAELAAKLSGLVRPPQIE